ncbi:MAG: glycosyltransferase [Nakamurella sp.]
MTIPYYQSKAQHSSATVTLRLPPAMPHAAPPEWPAARWVGSIDVAAFGPSTEIVLQDAEAYEHARLLVRDGTEIRGFVDVGVRRGRIDAGSLTRDIERLPRRKCSGEPQDWASITVVICTRDRPEHLRRVLPTILGLDYPNFDVVIVDNASRTSESRDLIRNEFPDPRLRIVEEPLPGLSRARNTGVAHASGEIVAFTDDDVAADQYWLREIARGFAQAHAVDCVTGLVPSGELRTRVQGYFDDRTSWSKNLDARVYSLSHPPADLPMFPFSVGQFGTGANFAVKRRAALELGGFDTALGVGTRTGGGEDLDFFTRVILNGRVLAMQPTALIWHRHRDDLAALRVQARGYGTGLGAWLAKIAMQPRTLRMALVRSPHALRRLVSLAWRKPEVSVVGTDEPSDSFDRTVARVGWVELFSVARGPWRYLRQRFEDTRAAH